MRSFNDWYFDLFESGNGACLNQQEIAEEAWDYRQTEVDELQKKNAWLSDVACRENKRANKLQEENVNTTTLLGKTIQEKNELQKRVDAALQLVNEMKGKRYPFSAYADQLEQALKGGEE
ncbi:hypothetical protein [Acinetobacter junii]|uniref:hypothetical protein n=1 Tax=Acinetobacter junii TaxID=40215 RepID=UPI000F665B90|nr:hypothetical protein [Acinetobacter junii]QXR26987.1 hypothetical protein EGT69_011910 [Acinetobacter junii]